MLPVTVRFLDPTGCVSYHFVELKNFKNICTNVMVYVIMKFYKLMIMKMTFILLEPTGSLAFTLLVS